MLALAPETVAMDEAAHFHSRAQARAQTCPILGDGKSARMGWHVQDYHPSGAVGNAAQADASRGAALCEAAGQALAQMLRELIALPLTTLADADDHA
jgi:creatinine amidohydrolase